ncbi:MAG: hypothetical protein ACYC9L_05565 [Sulfuricaulis sp.]
MSDNGASFFNANKASRNDAFAIPNNTNLDAETAGDQGARLYPVPTVLSNAQKVGNPQMEPAKEFTAGENTGRDDDGGAYNQGA